MKLILKKYKDQTEVLIQDDQGINLHRYSFDTDKEAQSFIKGWRCCQSAVNRMVQLLPQTYDTE